MLRVNMSVGNVWSDTVQLDRKFIIFSFNIQTSDLCIVAEAENVYRIPDCEEFPLLLNLNHFQPLRVQRGGATARV